MIGGLTSCYTGVVRGDSRQDLYAKLWALMGLGLLACAGALVDYWPADVRLPRIAGVPARATLARAYAVPRTTPPVVLAIEPAPYPRPASTIAARISASFGVERLAANATGDLAAPAESPTFDVVPAVATSAPAQQVALSLPAALEQPDTEFAEPLRQFSSGESPSDGSFFSDAFKAAGGSLANAGGSIVTAGVKTGQSVAGAFRVAAGAVKKLKFF